MSEQAVKTIVAITTSLGFFLILGHGIWMLWRLNARFNRALKRWHPGTQIELWFAKLDAPALIENDGRVRRLYRAYAKVPWPLVIKTLVLAALWISVGKRLLPTLLKGAFS
jgi:hypothetical protein